MKYFLLLSAALLAPSVACGQEMKSDTPQVASKPPVYTQNIFDKNAKDQVELMFDIDKTGNTVNCHVISSTNPEFNESALDHCRQQRYAPATINGVPIVEHHHRTIVTYSFDH